MIPGNIDFTAKPGPVARVPLKLPVFGYIMMDRVQDLMTCG